MSVKGPTIINQLREALDVEPGSLYAIADKAEVSRQSLGRFVRGQRGLTLETAAAVARVLGLSLVRTERRKPRRS